MKISLASDNWAAAHPRILEALLEANQGPAAPYGSDPWTEQAQQKLQQVFHKKAKVLFLPTGTGANVLALRLGCQSYESILCAETAHIECQETGATEAITGCKLLTVPAKNGKVWPQEVLRKLQSERASGKHATSPKILSLTQPTETGNLYQIEELQKLSQLCQKENLLLHIDGSRLFNAASAYKTSLRALLEGVEIDFLSLGATKLGALGAEALLIFNPQFEKAADFFQKQTLQLFSKMRYPAAQFLALFEKELWKELAENANQKAKLLSKIIEQCPDASLSYPVETNQIFFTATPSLSKKVEENIFCYLWNIETRQYRFITSWNTTEEEIRQIEVLFNSPSDNRDLP